MVNYDVIIVGGGHNGLVCACYLAKAGRSVRVVERRDIVGGAAVTEEFHPGFRNSTASYTVSLLQPKIIKDLNLHQHGLEILLRPLNNFLPTEDGRSLLMGGGLKATQSQIAQFSEHDAQALPAYYEMLEGVAEFLRSQILQTPPNIKVSISDAVKAFKLARQLNKLDTSKHYDILDLFTKSAAEILDQWFENDHVKAIFAFDSVVGNYASPYTPGSGYVLLHHVFGEVNGVKGEWGHAIGGMGAITQAMRNEAESLGVEITTGVAVESILVENQHVNGVELDTGEIIYAKTVVSNLSPKLLYLNLINERDLPAEFLKRIKAYRCGSATFRMNVALSELPDFKAIPGKNLQPHHQSGIVIAPTMKYMEKAYFDARTEGWSKEPIVEMLIPSTVDTTLAPVGQHVASLFCQHFDPELPDGLDWKDVREQAAQTIIEQVTRYAPNFKSSVIASQIHSPQDLENKFGLVAGDIMHGSLGLDQLYANRPLMGYGDYRTPIVGLYMCGSGTHPGGGVTGAPGHNAAREILSDL